MTSKERVMRVLDHGTPDRIPMHDTFWSEFVDTWRTVKGIGEDASPVDHYEIDIAICVANETLFPSQVGEIGRDGDAVLSRDGWGRTVRTKSGTYFYEQVDSVIGSKRDLDRIAFEPVDLDHRYTRFLHSLEANRTRCVFCKVGGPFIRTFFLRGEEAFLMDLAGDEPFARALAGRVGDHLTGIGLESLRRANLYDTGLWIYDDMAYNDGPMFSPRTFERVFLPIYRNMIQTFKNAGCRKVLLHSDGCILPVLDMLLDAGIDGINPVEPKAGMDLVALKQTYGKSLCYVGGVCNARVLPRGDRREIEAHVRPILDVAREGGVAIGTHSIGPDISVETYDYYHQLVRRYGTYSS